MIKTPESPLEFNCGKIMNNRFMLAPLTNKQSFEDGRISDHELNWLVLRAKGGFGLVMTCASHVQEIGKGFSGQLGIFSDQHIEGHLKLTQQIKKYGSLAVIQLHHAGMRSPKEIIHQNPVCPSMNEKHGVRELSLQEVKQLRDDFINAALRAKKSGYDGVEIHGAHGYILTQFLSKEINQRKDEYGGNLTNRSRILFEIVNGVREVCGDNFLMGVRLSPEKFGMDLLETKQICQTLIDGGKIDFLDISLWDAFKYPEEEKHQEKLLIEHFTDLNFQNVKLTVAGKIRNGDDVQNVLKTGADFVTIGRSAILHHDFPKQVLAEPNFKSISTPVSEKYLKKEGLSKIFIEYIRNWPNFVSSDSL